MTFYSEIFGSRAVPCGASEPTAQPQTEESWVDKHKRIYLDLALSEVTGQPRLAPKGSMAAQDDLAISLAALDLRDCRVSRKLVYRHAINCGMPADLAGDAAILAWAQQRAEAYRQSLKGGAK